MTKLLGNIFIFVIKNGTVFYKNGNDVLKLKVRIPKGYGTDNVRYNTIIRNYSLLTTLNLKYFVLFPYFFVIALVDILKILLILILIICVSMFVIQLQWYVNVYKRLIVAYIYELSVIFNQNTA